mgnify:CR=1 FL=1
MVVFLLLPFFSFLLEQKRFYVQIIDQAALFFLLFRTLYPMQLQHSQIYRVFTVEHFGSAFVSVPFPLVGKSERTLITTVACIAVVTRFIGLWWLLMNDVLAHLVREVGLRACLEAHDGRY